MPSCDINRASWKSCWSPAIDIQLLEVPMDSSQDLPLNDRYHERDVVTRIRDFDTKRHASDKRTVKTAERHIGVVGDKRIGMPTRARPSIGRRMFRSVSRFFIAVLLGVGATLAWQAHGDQAKEVITTWAPSLRQVVPSTTKSPTSATSSPELVQQLEPMARDLAIVRRGLEQLTAKQEQMSRSIATLHTIEKTSLPAWAAPILPRTPPQPAAKSSAVQ
jgi:hypothetical protein